MAWRVQHIDLHVARGKALAMEQQPVELRTVHRQIGRVELVAEDRLHFADPRTNADGRAGLRLDVLRAG